MKYRSHIVLLMSSLLFAMCGKGEIVEELGMTLECQRVDMGSFDLLEGSKEIFPYPSQEINIVFSDSLGNEIVATTSGTAIGYVKFFSSYIMCLEDSSALVNVSAAGEAMGTSVSIPALDIEFVIRYRVSPILNNYTEKLLSDVAIISIRSISLSDSTYIHPIPQMRIVLDIRTNPYGTQSSSMAEPSLFINMKEYLEVFSNTTGIDVIEIYYNHNLGIIGFREKATGVLYGFERFE